jgi:predicted membrane protein
MKNIATKAYDILGISSATLCLVHCVVFPLLTVIPIGLLHNPYIDLMFALLGFWAVLRVVKTASKSVTILLLVSVALIFASVLMDIFFHFHSNLIFIGGIGMVVGHLVNFRKHKKHQYS